MQQTLYTNTFGVLKNITIVAAHSSEKLYKNVANGLQKLPKNIHNCIQYVYAAPCKYITQSFIKQQHTSFFFQLFGF